MVIEAETLLECHSYFSTKCFGKEYDSQFWTAASKREQKMLLLRRVISDLEIFFPSAAAQYCLGKKINVHTFDKSVTIVTTNPSSSSLSFSKRSKRKLNIPTGSIIKENINAFDLTGDTSTGNSSLLYSSRITITASDDDYTAINVFRRQRSQPLTNDISINNHIITVSQSQLSIFFPTILHRYYLLKALKILSLSAQQRDAY